MNTVMNKVLIIKHVIRYVPLSHFQAIENKMNKKTCSLHLGMRSSTLESTATLVDFPDLIVTLFISAVICGILTFALVVVSNTQKLS